MQKALNSLNCSLIKAVLNSTVFYISFSFIGKVRSLIINKYFIIDENRLIHSRFLFIGGFYSDTLGYVAQGCKRCPNGSYVLFDKTPGKSVLDCKACPEGNQTTYPFHCLNFNLRTSNVITHRA